jgi:GTPase SAR1 family protein
MTLYKLVVLGDGGVGKVCQVLAAEKNEANVHCPDGSHDPAVLKSLC